MKCLAEVLLICCVVVSSSRSAEDATRSPLGTETAPGTTISALISTSMTTTAPARITTDPPEDEKHKPVEVPVDLLSTDKVLLDPNIVLARVARDTYAGWTGYRQTFSNPYERKPFGIQGYYDLERAAARPDRLKRRNDVRRSQPAPKRFRVYPVFPG